MSDFALVRTEDLVTNPATRLPVCICLDTSGSMNVVTGGDYKKTGETVYEDGKTWNVVTGGETKLSALQEGLDLFYDSVLEDPQARKSAELCIIEFNDDVNCLADFFSIEKQQRPTLSAYGDTHMGEAVNMALDKLEQRKQEYKDNGVDYYQPWLVIMTDGENNGSEEEMKKAADRVAKLVDARKLTVFPIGIGDTNMETLRQLSPKRSPLKLKGLKFKEFFTWLSQSVAKTSQSAVGDKIALNKEDIQGWGEI